MGAALHVMGVPATGCQALQSCVSCGHVIAEGYLDAKLSAALTRAPRPDSYVSTPVLLLLLLG